MRIAFVSDAVFPFNKGGKEKRLYDVSIRLADLGHRVTIYTMKWWKGDDQIFDSGVSLKAISKYIPLYVGGRRSIKEGIFFGLACLRLIKEDWDVIDVDHMPFFPLFSIKLVCILKRKEMIATWHEVWGKKYWHKYIGKLGYIAYLIEKLSVSLPNKIISISPLTTDRLKNVLHRSKEVKTIPIGIDYENIGSIQPANETSDLIYVGRLLEHKNVDVLIKSILVIKNSNPKIKCLVIGDGPEKRRLQRLIKRLRLEKNVILMGKVEEMDEVYALMKSSKVFVLPSTREGFGIVALEANACGLPVVTSNHPDNAAKDLISPGLNGYTCKLEAREMAKNIINSLEMIISPISDHYYWPKIIEELLHSYKPYNG